MSRKQVGGIITLGLALVAASTAGRAGAQELVDLKPGQRVRVELLRPAAGAGEPTTIEGRFDSVTADELVLLGEASEVRIPLRDIGVVERKRSRWGAVGKGALYGGLGAPPSGWAWPHRTTALSLTSTRAHGRREWASWASVPERSSAPWSEAAGRTLA